MDVPLPAGFRRFVNVLRGLIKNFVLSELMTRKTRNALPVPSFIMVHAKWFWSTPIPGLLRTLQLVGHHLVLGNRPVKQTQLAPPVISSLFSSILLVVMFGDSLVHESCYLSVLVIFPGTLFVR